MEMKYLIRKDKTDKSKARAHIWTGNEPACRSFSSFDKYKVVYEIGERRVCVMCQHVVFGSVDHERIAGSQQRLF